MPEKGFTIIELVISIFILSLAVVGVFSAFNIMSIFSADSADRLTAAYLAQEGMEIIRNIRDTNWLDMDYCAANPNELISPNGKACPGTWLDGFNACLTGCKADYRAQSNGSYIASGYINTDYLKSDNNGFYVYDGGTKETKFQRKITIEPIVNFGGSYDLAKVTTRVSWNAKASLLNNSGIPANADACIPANCVKVVETLYDWYRPLPNTQTDEEKLQSDFERIYQDAWADYYGNEGVWANDVSMGIPPSFITNPADFDASYYCNGDDLCLYDYDNLPPEEDYLGDCVLINLYQNGEMIKRKSISCDGCPSQCYDQ